MKTKKNQPVKRPTRVALEHLRAMQASAAAWLTHEELQRIQVELIDGVNFDEYPIDEHERALLASLGALIIRCVLDERPADLAVFLRALYTKGMMTNHDGGVPE